jgi:hypothetical protein
MEATRRRSPLRGNGRIALLLAIPVLVLLSFAAYGGDMAPAERWSFAVRPYLWVPSINGTLKYDIPPGSGGGGANVDLSYNLSFAFLMTAEARKGEWSIVTDFVYLDIGADDTPVKSVSFTGPGGRVEISAGADLGTQTSLSGVLWALAGAYTVAHGGYSTLDVLAGFRYLTLEAETDWQLSGTVTGPGAGQSFARTGRITQREDLWDGIVGIRGLLGLGSGKWGIPYYFDVGTGSSALTAQAAAGIQYRISWIDLQLMYRYLYYDMKSDQALQNVSFYGPAFGLNFRF